MKKIALVAATMVAMAFVTAIPSLADWTEKVTGSGYVSSYNFTVNVSASDDGAGGYTGQMQYTRPGVLEMHGDVACMKANDAGTLAIAVAPIKEQFDPADILNGFHDQTEATDAGDATWWGVAIQNNATGMDKVRVPLFTSEAQAMAYCNTSAPGSLISLTEGNFNIRAK